MLSTERFGKNDDILVIAERFGEDLTRNLKGKDIEVKGKFSTVKKVREIVFYDTESLVLRKNKFVFRRRYDILKHRSNFTLKIRDIDRKLVERHRLKVANASHKFEQDVKPEFQVLYSFSATCPVSVDRIWSSLGNIFENCPGLEDRLKSAVSAEPVERVGGFTALERVITGASIKLHGKTEAECGLILWHDRHGAAAASPLLVEFSFRYKDETGGFDGVKDTAGVTAFRTVQAMDWYTGESLTKTAFVYEKA